MTRTRSSKLHHAESRTPPEVFERVYRRRRDPWGYETRADERDKYEQTLAALDRPRYVRALEIGCSIGVFTEMLAHRCDRLFAIDPSRSALNVARDRLKDRPNVEFVEGAVPEALPPGQFDLVVCSEVLFYLSEGLLIMTLEQLQQRLTPGGTLIAVHYTKPASISPFARLASLRMPRPWAPLTGDHVHDLLAQHAQLLHSHEERRPTYRLDRFDAPA